MHGAAIALLTVVSILFLYLILVLIVAAVQNSQSKKQNLQNLQQLKWRQEQSKRTERVICLGLVRNAIEGLPSMYEVIKNVSSVFSNTCCIFVENGSRDGSREYIETKFKPLVPTTVIEPDLNHPAMENISVTGRGTGRILRMCYLRNLLLEAVDFGAVDVIIMFDADLKAFINVLDVEHAIDKLLGSPDIACVTGVGLGVQLYFPFMKMMVDTLAYVDEHSKIMGRYKAAAYAHLKNWSKEPADGMEVISNFSGFALYKPSAIENVRYEVEHDKEDHRAISEHVTFNKLIDGKIVLLPHWVIDIV